MGKPHGGQTVFSQAVADEICERIAKGETLSAICKDEHLPAKSTVATWAADNREGFAEQYARARERLLEHWADEIVDIADDASRDTIINERGKEVADSEWINRSRLRVDTRKWLLSKLRPDKYGEKLELSGDPKKPLVPVINVTIAPKPALASQARDSATDEGD
jgi:hypothetical protein